MSDEVTKEDSADDERAIQIVARLVTGTADKYVKQLVDLVGSLRMSYTVQEKIRDLYIDVMSEYYLENLSLRQIEYYESVVTNPEWIAISTSLEYSNISEKMQKGLAEILGVSDDSNHF